MWILSWVTEYSLNVVLTSLCTWEASFRTTSRTQRSTRAMCTLCVLITFFFVIKIQLKRKCHQSRQAPETLRTKLVSNTYQLRFDSSPRACGPGCLARCWAAVRRPRGRVYWSGRPAARSADRWPAAAAPLDTLREQSRGSQLSRHRRTRRFHTVRSLLPGCLKRSLSTILHMQPSFWRTSWASGMLSMNFVRRTLRQIRARGTAAVILMPLAFYNKSLSSQRANERRAAAAERNASCTQK